MKHLSTTPEPPSERRPGGAARARLDRPARAGEGPDRPLPEGRGDGRRPRARRARPGGRARDRGGGDAGAARRGRGDGLGARRPRSSGARSRSSRRDRRPTALRPGYYEYDEPIRRRSVWPWLLAALLVAAAIVARLVRLHEDPGPAGARRSRSPCRSSKGSMERLAVEKIEAAGLKVHVSRRAERQGPETGVVSTRIPAPETRTDKGNPVTIVVSTRQAEGDGAERASATRRPTRSPRSPSAG